MSQTKRCGYSSVVERHLAKVNVARSNRVTRLLKSKNIKQLLRDRISGVNHQVFKVRVKNSGIQKEKVADTVLFIMRK